MCVCDIVYLLNRGGGGGYSAMPFAAVSIVKVYQGKPYNLC